MVARFSAEAEYRVMAHAAYELIWVRSLMTEFGFQYDKSIPMYYDNQVAIFIANNPVFHERTKHIEVDFHFIRDQITSKQICTLYTHSEE